MENLIKRIAYLQGLAEGYEIDKESKEGKLLLGLIDVISELVDEVKESQEDLEEYVDIIEEDLSSLEDYVYEDEYDDFDLYDDYDDFDFEDELFYDDLDDDCDGECDCCEEDSDEE